MKCIKCKASCVGGSTRVQGDISYDFCKTCSAVLDSCPRNMILEFLTPEQQQSQVNRNIWAAKQRRALGQKTCKGVDYYNALVRREACSFLKHPANHEMKEITIEEFSASLLEVAEKYGKCDRSKLKDIKKDEKVRPRRFS